MHPILGLLLLAFFWFGLANGGIWYGLRKLIEWFQNNNNKEN